MLSVEFAGGALLAHLLSIISTPHLESLSFIHLAHGDLAGVDVKLLPTFPGVRTLVLIKSYYLGDPTLNYLFTVFPSVVQFIMHSCFYVYRTLHRLSEPRNKSAQPLPIIPWPDLRTFSLSGHASFASDIAMFRMDRARHPVKLVRLPRLIDLAWGSYFSMLEEVALQDYRF